MSAQQLADRALRHAQALRGQGVPCVRQTVGQLTQSAAISAPALPGAFFLPAFPRARADAGAAEPDPSPGS